jgi:phosphoribosylformimino-5-aminoimidazole carboxamide ribonucleotide (ProFAR) isomerase
VQFAKYMVEAGCMRIIFTDIARDGMLTGPNLEALSEMAEAVQIPVIASGGIKAASDVAGLRKIPFIEGLITGKALYEGTTTMRELLAAAQ